MGVSKAKLVPLPKSSPRNVGPTVSVPPNNASSEADLETQAPPSVRKPSKKTRSMVRSVPTPPKRWGSSQAHQIPNFSAGQRIDQYEFIRSLGQGGMGVVYLARDLRLGRLVAIKLLVRSRAGTTARFLSEAKTTARCNHENIVTIYDVDEYEGLPYMVLEYLEGQTLRGWMKAHDFGPDNPVSPSQTISLILPVVRALAYAHAQGIVHRDLKPANIILTESGTIKVLDFGVAKLLSEPGEDVPPGSRPRPPLATSHTFAGTVPYMSPEQLNANRIDHRSDIWAVGIMLFEMVAGRHPVPHMSPQTMLWMVDENQPMPSLAADMPHLGPLAAVIDRCLLKNKDLRTPDAQTLLQELQTLVSGGNGLRSVPDQNPYAGLSAFQEADADRFYGREQEVQATMTYLTQRPLVTLVGPSGTGKSSLIRAGVIPALKHSGEGWDTYTIRPGRQPLAALTSLFLQMKYTTGGTGGSLSNLESKTDHPTPDQVARRLRKEPGFFGNYLRGHAVSRHRRILLFVDQFEELYTQGADASVRAQFLAVLAGVADDVTSPLRVLVTMRSDFLDRLTEDGQLTTEVTRGLMLLAPMDRTGLRQALVRPLETSDFSFESETMVDRMVDALAGTSGALPLLQCTAAALWDRRDLQTRRMTEASYAAIGGVAGALASHADTVLSTLPVGTPNLVRHVMERLVTPERTRASVRLMELYELDEAPETILQLIRHLVATRLVVTETDAEGGRIVELIHESLIDRWPTLVRWLDENHEDAVFLARLRSAAREWEKRGQDEGLLWHGAAAKEAELWQLKSSHRLSPKEQAFMQAVVEFASRADVRRRWVRRGLFGGMALLLIVTWTGLVMIANAERMTRKALALKMAQVQLQSSLKEAIDARQEAEHARLQSEKDAEAARKALHRAKASEAETKASEARARKATRQAKAERDRAHAARQKALRSEKRLRQFIRRSFGHVSDELPPDSEK